MIDPKEHPVLRWRLENRRALIEIICDALPKCDGNTYYQTAEYIADIVIEEIER